MNKSNLINAIASDANLTNADAGRNSQIGAQITIVVAKNARFYTGKALKAAVNYGED